MNRTLKGQGLDPLQPAEASDPGPISIDLPDPSVGTAPMPAETEYEIVGGINQNIKEPDTESSNAASESSMLSDTAWELGDPGSAMGDADEFGAVDAIYGSYPDLIDTALAEVVIGPDNRVRVQNTAIYPWRAICGLRILAANGARYIGTGWLIGPRTVITAGHCVFLHDAGGWARSIEVIPGLNDSSRPFGSHTGTALRSVTGWTQSKNRDFDYGAIILPPGNRPGAQTGTFGFAVRNDAFLRSAALNLSGYPGDKGGSQQWFHAQKAKSVSSRVIAYEIDTAGGQSGSPVWVLQNGQRYAVGIHTNGASSGNSATRIVTPVFNNLQSWKNQGA
jgi:V8-like Glu-specific endopeptidase